MLWRIVGSHSAREYPRPTTPGRRGWPNFYTVRVKHCLRCTKLVEGLRVTLKPWRPVLPGRRKGKSIAIRHFDLRQTLGVHDFVFLDDVVLVQQEGGERIHLVRG